MPSDFRAGGPCTPRTRLADGRLLEYKRPLLMGIINVTPDSFYGASRCAGPDAAVAAAEAMLNAGADILDIGGESTRPGAPRVDAAAETERLSAAVYAIRKSFPKAVISADTSKAAAAQAALDCGADIINDVTALSFDAGMAAVVRRSGAPVVLMHNRGASGDMQNRAVYSDAAAETLAYLKERAAYALDKGIAADKIILDPGMGFAKKLEHNLAVMRRIEEFFKPGFPLLVGASRKTFIGLLLGSPEAPVPPEGRLEGTLASTVYLAAKGVHIIRVHDVKENAAALKVAEALWQ